MDSEHFDSLYPADARYEEIEKILGYIREGNSCQLIGIPGVGRSNLLGFLAYNRNIKKKHLGNNADQFHFVMVNFSEVKKKPLFDITKLIFLSILESIREKRVEKVYEKINTIFKESLSYQDELILFQGLKKTVEILANEGKLTIVLLCERFEEYVPMVTSDFFTNLRVLRNRAKYHFSIIFSLNRPLEELLEPALMTDFYEFLAGNTIYLPIADIPGNNFRIAYLEKITQKKIDKKIIEKIINYTAGHGKLTRICTEIVLANPSQPSLIREGAKKSLLNKGESKGGSLDFFLQHKRVQNALYEIWKNLSPLEQTCLASDKPCEHADPTYLEFVEICKNNKISIPLLSAFAKERAKEIKVEKHTIVFNADTNTITRGDLVLSDTLTTSEFRLLFYLIQHAEVIVSKEELITAVWKDAKSTAGVTDQALDQLIFRLRKKIENDPNNPHHIQTIKGRGIKFIP